MTVAELRELLNNTPAAFDNFEVALDSNGEPIHGWSVEPKESGVEMIRDTYENTLYLF
jgi:hypothetical protein